MHRACGPALIGLILAAGRRPPINAIITCPAADRRCLAG
jgi:hypothetical protein